VVRPLSEHRAVRQGTGSSFSSFDSGGSHRGGGDDGLRDDGQAPASHNETRYSSGTYSTGSTVDSRGAHGSNGPSGGGASFYSSGHSRVVFPLPPSSPHARMESVEIQEHEYRPTGPLPPPSSFAPPLLQPLHNLQHPQFPSTSPLVTNSPPAYAIPLVSQPLAQPQHPPPSLHINPTPFQRHSPPPPSRLKFTNACNPQPHYRSAPPRSLNLLPMPSQSLQHQHSPPFANLRQAKATPPPMIPLPPIPQPVAAPVVVVPTLRSSSSIASFFKPSKASSSPPHSIQSTDSSTTSTKGILSSPLSSAFCPPPSSSSGGKGKSAGVRFASPVPDNRRNAGEEVESTEVREETERRKGEAMQAMARSFSLLM
jgi:hypothetical protein